MDRDEAKGAGHEVKGDIKEMTGIATGKESKNPEDKAEKGSGTAQRKVKDIQDDILDMPKE